MNVTERAANQGRGGCHLFVALGMLLRTMYSIISDFREQTWLPDEGVACTIEGSRYDAYRMFGGGIFRHPETHALVVQCTLFKVF